MDATDRSLRARLAASVRWAQEPDRSKATRPARAGLQAKFEREVDPEGLLAPDERARRAESAKRAHFTRMALARRRRRST